MTTNSPAAARAKKKLKPCPFCGSKDITIVTNNLARGGRNFILSIEIGCDDCGARGGKMEHELKPAITAWNRRTK